MSGTAKRSKVVIDDAALAGACASAIPVDGHGGLLKSVGRVAPDLSFKSALVREGWYRMGGLVDALGDRVASDLRAWVEEESGGDVGDLVARHIDAGLRATRLCGKSIYLTARYGDEPLDFIQVEVEEIQEVVDRLLIREDALAEDIEELVDPVDAPRLPPTPVGGPRYHLRRFTDFSTYLSGGGVADAAGHKNFMRFIAEWTASSAGAENHFGDHWVLTLLPYTDRFGERRYNVKPRPLDAATAAAAAIDQGVEPGLALGRALQAFDRAAGFPMAWYFVMVVGGGVSHKIAETAALDLKAGFAYLPTRDAALVEGWINDPYGL